MIGGAAITVINNARGAMTEDGVWLALGALALAAVVIAALEWRRRKRLNRG